MASRHYIYLHGAGSFFVIYKKRKELDMEEVHDLSEELYLDVLTEAYNRRYYEEKVKNAQGYAGIAMIDLDDFKLYNDSFGHSAGDEAIEVVAKVIQKVIGDTGKLIRYGGDEFVLVFPEIGEKEFISQLEKIHKKINQASLTDHTGLQISVSIGGTMAKNEVFDEVVKRADRLMYQAKNEKNTIVTEVESEKLSPLRSDIKEAKQQILIVDDSQMNRELLAEMLQEDFKIMEAENGKQAVEILQKYGSEIALVLLDIIMPVMNGFEVLEVMNEKHMMEDIPVIMISTENTDEIIRQAYELGVSDYINRPFDARIVYRRVNNTIKLYAKQRRLINLVKKQVEEKENNNQIMISILSHIVEFRNGESGAHVLHINILTEMLLERLMHKTDQYPLTWTERHLIPTASALHDIGKIGIEEKILNKPGKLTKEEFEIMKTHTLIGAEMLKDIQVQHGEELVKIAYEICRWHHERYDGRGYPDGLKGEEIPISAQVVSLADVYDALVSERVYKKAFSHETAIEMIKNGECGIFNPILIECMLEIQDKMREAYHIK